MATPTWAPSLEAVADYITSRTLDSSTPGDDTPLGTFTPTTYPTDVQVLRLIDGASSWLTNAVGTLVPALEDSASAIVAMRTAGLVELSYPERDADITIGPTLLNEANAALEGLKAANVAGGGVGVTVGATPLGHFPLPSCWRGDDPVRR